MAARPRRRALPPELTDLDDVLVVAHEWLDVVPRTVAEVVEPAGSPWCSSTRHRRGVGCRQRGRAHPRRLPRCARHWPTADQPVGARVEVGLARDQAWRDLVAGRAMHPARRRLRTHGRRPAAGRHPRGLPRRGPGRARTRRFVRPHRPRRGRLARARRADHPAGGAALAGPGCRDPTGSTSPAPTPAGYLGALARASAAGALLAPDGLGGFAWVVRRVQRMSLAGPGPWHRCRDAVPDAPPPPSRSPSWLAASLGACGSGTTPDVVVTVTARSLGSGILGGARRPRPQPRPRSRHPPATTRAASSTSARSPVPSGPATSTCSCSTAGPTRRSTTRRSRSGACR